jgi:hypothetical protein
MRAATFAACVCVLLSGSPAALTAQSRTSGYVSTFVDWFPSEPDAAELRARVFVEHKAEPSKRVRVNLAGFAEGLFGSRKRERVEDSILRVHDASLELIGGKADLLAGFTRVAWGRLDELQPTDVINPLDVSRFFFEGRSEARMPVALVRGRVFVTDDVTIEAVVVPVFRRGRFDQLDEPTSPFNLTRGRRVDVERKPSNGADSLQGGGRLSVTTGRVDWSVSAFRGLDPFGGYALVPFFGPLQLPPPGVVPKVIRTFPRFTMIGGDFETARGEWGLRGEAAVFVEDSFQEAGQVVEGTSIDAGVGVDRKAGAYRVSGTVLVHTESYDTPLFASGTPERSRTDLSLIASADRTFAREKHNLRLFAVFGATEQSSFVRGIWTFKPRDAFALESSIGWFAGDGRDLIGRFSESDFVYARFKYYF